MSAKPETDESAKAPAKSKKLLIIVGAAVLVVSLLAGGAFFYISKQRAAAAEDADAGGNEKTTARASPKTPPAYLPLDSMVVNLADPGGEKVAQIGITLEVVDAHAVDTVKAFLPTIRSGILLLVSQRTSEELLKPEGKQQLAKDILRETSRPFGGGEDEDEEESPRPKKKKKASKSDHADMPVVGVLFSSFIVQ